MSVLDTIRESGRCPQCNGKLGWNRVMLRGFTENIS